ncbi:tumor necrosis factor receptor superfamily member 1A isoform X2 [Sardina pilchardus]|uniref:tumor necrosis factor receptor superfamily member 1A isoform X2 n=1 Tax=Sardina pilchardus TaxID=27697 RepID=UPI002E12D24A
MHLIINIWILFIFKLLPIITALECKKCDRGFFLEKHLDDNCPGDSVKSQRSCDPCITCDAPANQIEVTNCTPTKDRVCGCKDGHYSNKVHEKSGILICMNCVNCHNHSECPECPKACKNGMYMDDVTCKSCQKQNCDNPQCKDTDICASELPVLVIVIALIVPLIVGLLLISIRHLVRCGRKPCWSYKKDNNNLPDQHEDTHRTTQIYIQANQGDQDQIMIPIPQEVKVPAPCAPVFESLMQPSEETQKDTYTQSLIKNESRSHFFSPILLTTQHPCPNYEAQVLYTIIREVPVRRWKEFLRLLAVPDEEIERVEMETGASYLERQYQMLRLWSQASNGNLESLYSTLHSMDLSGCADKLQDKLQRILYTTTKPTGQLQ